MAQTIQSGTTLDQLPPALALNGGELFWIYQAGPTEATPWIGLRCSTAQIAQLVADLIGAGLSSTAITMRQLIAAMAAEDTLVGVYESLPSDLTNSYNIAWSHAYIITISDPFIVGFLQPTLGYSSAQMQALFAAAAAFPA
jgi:hypothetical protein